MKNFFSGMARLRVSGLNLDKLLNSIVKNNIKVFDVEREERAMSFSVPYKMQKRIAEIAQERPYNIVCVWSYGLPALLSWASKRRVLIISMAVAFALLVAFNTFIWEVRIRGLDTIAYSEVQNVLDDMGVSVLSSKSKIERTKIENQILASVPNVSYVNVYFVGVTLFVDIVEALPKEIAQSREPRDLYAQADGVITRIVTISGTSLVKVGDSVKAGQVLISRTVTYADGSTVEVRADGEVYAHVNIEGEAAFFGSEAEFEKNIENLQKKAQQRALAIMSQVSCVIDTKYDIIDTLTGKVVKATVLVERRIDS